MSTPTIRAALDAAEQHATAEVWADHPLAIILKALIKQTRAALAAEPVGEGPSDEEVLDLMPQQFRDDLATVSRLASYGTPAPDVGEVGEQPVSESYKLPEPVQPGELAAWLRTDTSKEFGPSSDHPDAARLTRIATLLQQQQHLLKLALRELDLLMERPPAPAPAVPEAGDVGELVAWLRTIKSVQAQKAATLLEQQAAPAPAVVPVEVSERPWEWEGWCNAEGQCWALSPDHNSWQLVKPRFLSFWVLLLPAHAIPLPQVGEGES